MWFQKQISRIAFSYLRIEGQMKMNTVLLVTFILSTVVLGKDWTQYNDNLRNTRYVKDLKFDAQTATQLVQRCGVLFTPDANTKARAQAHPIIVEESNG